MDPPPNESPVPKPAKVEKKPVRALLRVGMRLAVVLYRWTGGRIGGRVQGLRVLLLTTTGRRTGRKHTVPVGFFRYEGAYVVTASNGGQDTHPGWLLNLRSDPATTIRIGRRDSRATAAEAPTELRDTLWGELMQIAPGYAKYEQRTSRRIPMILLRPL